MVPYFDQDGVHEIYRSWRSLLEEYPGQRIAVAEAWAKSFERTARYVRPDELHQAFNFKFLNAPWDATRLRELITTSLAAMHAVDAPTTWTLSNHDVVRHASRYAEGDPARGLRRARAAALLMLALPGSAYLYQGEELGLPEVTDIPDDMRRDAIRPGAVPQRTAHPPHRSRTGSRPLRRVARPRPRDTRVPPRQRAGRAGMHRQHHGRTGHRPDRRARHPAAVLRGTAGQPRRRHCSSRGRQHQLVAHRLTPRRTYRDRADRSGCRGAPTGRTSADRTVQHGEAADQSRRRGFAVDPRTTSSGWNTNSPRWA